MNLTVYKAKRESRLCSLFLSLSLSFFFFFGGGAEVWNLVANLDLLGKVWSGVTFQWLGGGVPVPSGIKCDCETDQSETKLSLADG